ncbi:MAG: hypothetical protein U0232_25665 [Thermomicrobiales bacterium]
MAGQFRNGAAMRADTPEDLESLFEDALLLRDGAALGALFEEGALFVAGDGPALRDGEAIIHRALALWDGEQTYIAEPKRVLQMRDLALVVTERGIAVMRRGSDESWRYAIALLDLDVTAEKEAHA